MYMQVPRHPSHMRWPHTRSLCPSPFPDGYVLGSALFQSRPEPLRSRWHRLTSIHLRLRDPNALRAEGAVLYGFALILVDQLQRPAIRGVVDFKGRMALDDDLRVIKVDVLPAWTSWRTLGWRVVVVRFWWRWRIVYLRSSTAGFQAVPYGNQP